MSIKKVSFGISKVQKLRRVALDPNLLTTVELQEGDRVSVDLDVGSGTILIRKVPAASLKNKTRKSRA